MITFALFWRNTPHCLQNFCRTSSLNFMCASGVFPVLRRKAPSGIGALCATPNLNFFSMLLEVKVYCALYLGTRTAVVSKL